MVVELLSKDTRPIVSLYRGVTSNLIGSSVAWGAFFGVKEFTQDIMARNKQSKLTKSDYFWSAIIAGFATQAVTNPIFVVKTRMLATDRETRTAYPTTLAAIQTMWREEGWRVFYNGMAISTVAVFQGGIQFALYDPMTRWYKEQQSERDGKIHPLVTMAMSGFGKAVPHVATYPYQVIRSRLQVQDAEAKFGKGIRGVCLQMWKETGFRGFYRGLMPSICRSMPSTWATFLAYEQLKPYLTKRWIGDKDNEYGEP